MNEQLYNVSANPHVRDKASTHSIMLDVIIALLPATLFGFWNFGVKAIINTVICILSVVPRRGHLAVSQLDVNYWHLVGRNQKCY